MCSTCFPRSALPTDASLSSTGSSEASSPASRVLSKRYDFLPSVPLRFVAFARRYHPCTLASLPPAWSATPGAWGFRCFAPVTPVRILGWRRQGLPGSWGVLSVTCPALRPRWDADTRPLGVRRVAFRATYDVGSHVKLDFGARSHSLQPRCLRFAARVTPAPRKTRFRLAANLHRVGLLTHRTPKTVSSRHTIILRLQAFLAHRKNKLRERS